MRIYLEVGLRVIALWMMDIKSIYFKLCVSAALREASLPHPLREQGFY